jgi:putative resolvase
MEKLITIKQAADMLGVSQWTLRRYTQDYLPSVVTGGGHRRYKLSDVSKLQGTIPSFAPENPDCVAMYCRVSSSEQKTKGDLDRQKLRLIDYCVSKKYKTEYIFEEVGSGMSDTRKKLHKLFELVFARKINKVIVEHKDRLARFNFRIYEAFFNSYGVIIEYIEETLPKSFEAELVEDMLSLLSSFSAKIYGKRSSENKNKNKVAIKK